MTKAKAKFCELTWCEISKKALKENVRTFRKRIGAKVLMAPAVKANAYGHGMAETAKIVLEAGADVLCVNALFEAEILRKAGIKKPIYVMGYVLQEEAKKAVQLNCTLVVYNKPTLAALSDAAKSLRKKAKVYFKIETGNNRQGILPEDLLDFALGAAKNPHIEIVGAATHFANIEDTVSPDYAEFQLENFKTACAKLSAAGVKLPIRHCANSAATMIYPKTHFEMVRPGIAIYGLWPSTEVKTVLKAKKINMDLVPVLTWKTRVAQIKTIKKGSFIGYGCTYKTTRDTVLAILPVGYYDGYDRSLSNKSYVLIKGARAPLRGRVCMNIMMADVTDIPGVRVEDEVVLLGRDGKVEISADTLADLAGTINYEITTRICERIPRITV